MRSEFDSLTVAYEYHGRTGRIQSVPSVPKLCTVHCTETAGLRDCSDTLCDVIADIAISNNDVDTSRVALMNS